MTSIAKSRHFKNIFIVVFSVALFSSAWAFDASTFLPPEYKLVDSNNINLATNEIRHQIITIQIGSEGRKLSDHAEFGAGVYGGYLNSEYSENGNFIQINSNPSNNSKACQFLNGYVQATIPVAKVYYGHSIEEFCNINGAYIPTRNAASSLVQNLDGSLSFLRSDGTVYLYSSQVAGRSFPSLVRITQPDGLIYNLTYQNGQVYSVTRNDGLQLIYQYTPSSTPSQAPSQTISTAVNNTLDFCNPAVASCSLSNPGLWPTATYTRSTTLSSALYGYSVDVIVDQSGNRYTYNSSISNGIGVLTSYTAPGATNPSASYEYCQDRLAIQTANAGLTPAPSSIYSYSYFAPDGTTNPDGSPGGQTYDVYVAITSSNIPEAAYGPIYLCKVTKNGGVWNYSVNAKSVGATTIVMMKGVSNPYGGGSSIVSVSAGMVAAMAPLNIITNEQRTAHKYDMSNTYNRLYTKTYAEGNYDYYDGYDSRGNVTSIRHYPKPGSTLSPTVETAGYDATCTYPAKCNKPNWIKDANGNQTDFVYDTAYGHGGLLTQTSPADSRGIRPQKRISYTHRSAWFKDASGGYVAGSPIWLVDKESYCISTAASGAGCAGGAADEVVTQYEYGPDSGPNNLFLRGVAVTAVDETGVIATHRTCYAYDVLGNKISETTANGTAGLTSCP